MPSQDEAKPPPQKKKKRRKLSFVVPMHHQNPLVPDMQMYEDRHTEELLHCLPS